MNEIQEFCDKHNACQEGKDWALENCQTMDEVWQTAKPEWLIWVAIRKGVLSDKELRLFACWCVRQIWDLLTDERSKNAIIVAEKFAKGEATEEELKAAAADAADAAYADAADAAYAAAYAAADAARQTSKADQAKYLRSLYNPFKKQ